MPTDFSYLRPRDRHQRSSYRRFSPRVFNYRLGPTLPALLLACSALGCGVDEKLPTIIEGSVSGDLFAADGGFADVLDELDPDSDSAAAVRGYLAILDLARERAEYFCECELQTTEGPDWERCLRDLNPTNPPPLLECTKRVLAQSPKALSSIECEMRINTDYMACVKSAATCFDFAHITDCDINRITASLECEEFPWDVWALDQEFCWGNEQPPPFTCDNGKVINSAWQCDIEDDCGDGSDEAGCENNPHSGLDGF